MIKNNIYFYLKHIIKYWNSYLKHHLLVSAFCNVSLVHIIFFFVLKVYVKNALSSEGHLLCNPLLG